MLKPLSLSHEICCDRAVPLKISFPLPNQANITTLSPQAAMNNGLECLNEAVWLAEMSSFTLFYISSAAERIFGCPVSELCGKRDRWLERIHPDDQPQVRNALAAFPATGNWSMAYRILQLDGAVRWLHDRAWVVRDEAGNVEYVEGIISDITVQRLLPQVMEPQVIEPQVMEPQAMELQVMEPQVMASQAMELQVMEPQVMEPQVMASQAMEPQVMEPQPLPQVGWQDQSVVASQSFSQIAAQLDLEIARRQQTEIQLQAVLDHALDAILITDQQGQIVEVNPSACELLALPKAELLNKAITTWVALGKDRTAAWTHLPSGERYRGELEFSRADGIHWLEYVAIAHFQPDRHLVILRDITERKQAEAAIRQVLEQQQTLNELKYRFITIAAHEFRNPLAVIFSSAELLEYYDQQWSSQEKQHHFQQIQSAVEEMTTLLEGLLAFDQVELSQVPLTSTSVPLERSLYALVKTLQSEERHRLEDAWRQQVQREQLLSKMAQRIRQSLELDEILTTTVSEVREFLQTDRVLLYQFNPDKSGTIVVESVNPGWRSLVGTQIYDPCFAERYVQQYQQGRVRTIDNLYTSGIDPCHIELLERFQVKANLVVPILQGDNLWGLLIAHHCTHARQWEPWEARFLKQLAVQVAIAIQQSELYQQVHLLNTQLEQQVQDRTAQLQQSLHFGALLQRIADKVRDSLDESQILQAAVQEVAVGLSIGACSTALYALDQQRASVCYEYVTDMVPDPNRVRPIAADSALYSTLLQGQVWRFNEQHPLRGEVSVLACPMVDDQGVLGDLWLYKHQAAEFSEAEIQLAQQVANQCAIAIRQSRLYQAAETQVRELEKLNRLKDDFLSTVSHELRTPMSSIKMAIQMLEIVLRQTNLLSADLNPAAKYFHILRSECQREINLINDLLDLSRLDAGSEPLVLTTMALQTWLPHVTETFAERTEQQQQQLQIQIEPTLPALTADFKDLERIIIELLHNACKYTPSGGAIAVTATIVAENESPTLQLCISNSGVDIPPDALAHIFDKFYRVPNNDPWKHGGTGLGLALAKKRAERMGATLTASSSSRTVAFTLKFPPQSSQPLAESTP